MKNTKEFIPKTSEDCVGFYEQHECVRFHDTMDFEHILITCKSPLTAPSLSEEERTDQRKQLANFLAQTLNVTNETGKTPRELLELLVKLSDHCGDMEYPLPIDLLMPIEDICREQRAIKAKNATA
jgi:hypothetical protein